MLIARVLYTMIYNIVYTSFVVIWVLNKAMGHRQNCFYCFLIEFILTSISTMQHEV